MSMAVAMAVVVAVCLPARWARWRQGVAVSVDVTMGAAVAVRWFIRATMTEVMAAMAVLPLGSASTSPLAMAAGGR